MREAHHTDETYEGTGLGATVIVYEMSLAHQRLWVKRDKYTKCTLKTVHYFTTRKHL